MERLGGDGNTGGGGGDGGGGDGDVERRGVGRGRGRGSWSPMPSNTQEVQMLRRPHQSVSGAQTPDAGKTKGTEQPKSRKSLDDLVMNSTLSVDAAEFVPKSFSVEQPGPQQQARFGKNKLQDRIQRARETSNHMHMMQSQYYGQNYGGPQQYQQEQVQQHENFSHQHQTHQRTNAQDFGQFDGGSGDRKDKPEAAGEDENFMLDFTNTTQQLLNVIHLLILTPGRFSLLVPAVIKSIRPYLEFPNQFREFIGIVIQQSINESNFRYSGARLCTSFDSSVTLNEQATFREILFALCKEETENQAAQWQQKKEHSEEEERKCHGLILFLAELVTQMQEATSCGLGGLLIQLITVVLKNPASNSVKHICQALKLAGQTLERDRRGSRGDMENMMRALTQLVTEARVDSHVGRMVNSVHELRNGNWGQNVSGGSSAVENTESSEPPDGPVSYGPDGQILSPEENQFLEDVAESTNSEDHAIGGQGDGEIWMSEEEDEIDAAYEEFLKLIPKKIGNKAHK